VHDLALKVVLQHLSRKDEQTEDCFVRGGSVGIDKDIDAGAHASKNEQISKGKHKAASTSGAVTARAPEKNPDDLWYSFVFSDANTEDLHREVLAEAQKEIKTGGGPDKTDQSGWGRTISDAATVGQPSVIGTSEMEDDLKSLPEACASHTAALASSMTTQTSDHTFFGSDSEASRGSSHAAPSIYAETDPSRTCSLAAAQKTFTDESTVQKAQRLSRVPLH
jgi:hypothetical protein